MSFGILTLSFIGALALVLGVIFAGVWVVCSIMDNTARCRNMERRMDMIDKTYRAKFDLWHEMEMRVRTLERAGETDK